MPARNIWGRYAKVTVLPDGRKGSNARGTCLHKPTRGAKVKPRFESRPPVNLDLI